MYIIQVVLVDRQWAYIIPGFRFAVGKGGHRSGGATSRLPHLRLHESGDRRREKGSPRRHPESLHRTLRRRARGRVGFDDAVGRISQGRQYPAGRPQRYRQFNDLPLTAAKGRST